MARGRAGRPRGRGAAHRRVSSSPSPPPPPSPTGRRPYTRRLRVEKEEDEGGEGRDTAPTAAPSRSPTSARVWLAPRGRMLTRGLLRGTSPAVDLTITTTTTGGGDSSGGVAEVPPVAGQLRRRRRGAWGVSASQEGPSASAERAEAEGRQVGGLLHCICNQYFTTNKDVLLECARCHNWSHPSCWGVDYNEVWRYKREGNYTCAFCKAAGADGAAALPLAPASPVDADDGAPGSPTTGTAQTFCEMNMNAYDRHKKAPPPLKLREVPDLPPGAQRPARQQYVEALEGVLRVAARGGYAVVFFGPPNALLSAAQLHEWNAALRADADGADVVRHTPVLAPATVEACYDCCRPSVAEATFSPDYPYYCLHTVSAGHHPYLQGTLLRPRGGGGGGEAVCAFVLSNGMDFYSNLKSTVTQLKMAHRRGEMPLPAAAAAAGPLHTYRTVHLPYLLHELVDTSDFVHITLSATHPRYQQRGLAKLLLTLDLLRWLWRGRTRAVLNMAIEKKIVYPKGGDGAGAGPRRPRRRRAEDSEEEEEGEGPVLMYTPSPASRHLYTYFHFFDVYPKVDAQTKEEVWTAKESEHGRVMVNYQMRERVCAVAAAYQQGALTVGPADGARPPPPPLLSRRERGGRNGSPPAPPSLVAAVNSRRPYKKRQPPPAPPPPSP